MSVAFDALDYIEGAEKVGIKREHAEYNARQIFKFLDETISTKKDISSLEDSVVSKINETDKDARIERITMEKDIRKDMNSMENSLRQELINLEYRIMTRLGSLMVICSGAIITILGFILKI